MGLKYLDCSEVKNLEDIQGSGTEDTSTIDQAKDAMLVSCLQTGKYNELKDKIDKYYSSYKDDESFYQSICEFCKNKSSINSSQWEGLYSHLESDGFIKL